MARRRRSADSATTAEEPSGDLVEVATRRRRGKRTEEEAPSASSAGAPAAGWGAFKDKKEAVKTSGDFINFKEDGFKPTEEETLVYFLDDEPFAVYYDVWVPGYGGRGRSFSTMNDENPLTEHLALKPQPRALFNVLVFDEEGECELKVMRCAVRLAELVEKMASGPRTSPLSKFYWEMSATGTSQSYTPLMNPYKPGDLQEDWGFEPLSDEEVAEFREEAFTADGIFLHDDTALMNVVKELSK